MSLPHPRAVIIIEGDEESGSNDIEIVVERNLKLIGDVNLVICLDSGCKNYDQLWYP